MNTWMAYYVSAWDIMNIVWNVVDDSLLECVEFVRKKYNLYEAEFFGKCVEFVEKLALK